jgi:serine/threonine-protein kinase
MVRAMANLPVMDFVQPDVDLVTVTIDTRSGCLATRFTPEEFRGEGVYTAGTEPKPCKPPKELATVPNVVGFSSVPDAVRLLIDAGFDVEQVEEQNLTYPPGVVIAQSPGGGQKALQGSTVTVTISTRHATGDEGTNTTDENSATVPSVLGLTRAEAEANLRSAGFDPRTVTQAESSPGQAKKRAGRVWKQDPGSGSTAPRGSVVTIYVNP